MYINVPHRLQLLLSKSMRKLEESSFLQALICLQDPHKQALMVPSLQD